MGVNQGSNVLTNELHSADEEFGFFDKELKKIVSMMKGSLSQAIDKFHGEASSYLKKNSVYIHKLEESLEREVEKNPMPTLIIAGFFGWLLNSFMNKAHGNE